MSIEQYYIKVLDQLTLKQIAELTWFPSGNLRKLNMVEELKRIPRVTKNKAIRNLAAEALATI
jgi:hypothetical protein